VQDLIGDVKYEMWMPKLAKSSPSGRSRPLATASRDHRFATANKAVKFSIKHPRLRLTCPSLTTQIVPIFTKLGVHSGGLHGKASGQNGSDSLLGFEPEVIQRPGKDAPPAAGGCFPRRPDYSLLLQKFPPGRSRWRGTRMGWVRRVQLIRR